MTDIVERLRIYKHNPHKWGSISQEAADEIERLCAEIKTVTNTAKINLKVARERGDEIERLRSEICVLKERLARCSAAADAAHVKNEQSGDEIEQLHAVNADLLEALIGMVAEWDKLSHPIAKAANEHVQKARAAIARAIE